VWLIDGDSAEGDGVVNSLNEKRVFGSASEAKSAVDYITAGLIGSFIVLSAVLAAQQ
jgi:preprotein translocase subunit SecG